MDVASKKLSTEREKKETEVEQGSEKVCARQQVFL